MVPSRTSAHNKMAPFVVFFVITAFVYVGSCIVSATSVEGWYKNLSKASFNPPDWTFAPVWAALYLMMAIAGWMAWCRSENDRRQTIAATYGIQLALNGGWTILFFRVNWVGAALIEIVFLWLSILWTACVFWPVDKRAALLLVPYVIWAAFAIILNAAIWILND